MDYDLLLQAQNCELAAQLSRDPDVAAHLTRLAQKLRQDIAVSEQIHYCEAEAEDSSADTAEPAVRPAT